MDDEEKEARRKRQAKKMTKIIAKAWNLPHAEHFTQVVSPAPAAGTADANSAAAAPAPLDLTGIGQALDAGAYHLGRHGWERFAADLGGVYNRSIRYVSLFRHILCRVFACVVVKNRALASSSIPQSCSPKLITRIPTHSQGKHKKSARRNLDEVKTLLAKVDAHLAEIAETSGTAAAGAAADAAGEAPAAKKAAAPASGKKRKSSDAAAKDASTKKKKAAKEDLASLTIPQREQRALEQLGNYLEEVGGESFILIDGFSNCYWSFFPYCKHPT